MDRELSRFQTVLAKTHQGDMRSGYCRSGLCQNLIGLCSAVKTFPTQETNPSLTPASLLFWRFLTGFLRDALVGTGFAEGAGFGFFPAAGLVACCG